LLIKSGKYPFILFDKPDRFVAKSSLLIFFVNNLIWELTLEKNKAKKEIEIKEVDERIRITLKTRDFINLSILSTLGRKIVVNRKEKTSIPIIEAKKGKIFQASPLIMIINNSL